MRRLGWAALMCVGCRTTPPRVSNAPPDILLVLLDTPIQAPASLASDLFQLGDAQAVHTDPIEALQAVWTGRWPGTASTTAPNTLHGVLRLYGYLPVGRLPTTDWKDGLETPPWSADACLPAQIAAASEMQPQPPDLATFVVVGPDPCGQPNTIEALTSWLHAENTHPRVLAVVSLGAAPNADWQIESPATLWFAGSGFTPGAHDALASAVDVLPTLLAAAGAVVPSDAAGIDLHAVSTQGPAAAPVAVFPQKPGAVAIVTKHHRLVVPELPLPAAAPSEAVLTQRSEQMADDSVQAALYTTLRGWDQQRTATSAADRMGDQAFREMLRDQGYWH